MPPKKKRKIESYSHEGRERPNNPPAGLASASADPYKGEKRAYQYDPHLDPQLQWAGKAERASFEIPTVSLHVHELIEPRTIVEAVRKRNGNNGQMSLFEAERSIPIRQAIEFYKHSHNWSNRLIAGDSLLVMNSLLEKEAMAGKVQCVYIDPPYGIKYGSNFQPFINRRDVKDGKDEDLTAEPEMIKAFRDTWELGIHSYLSYMRDRLLLARELLTDSGSCFVQISDENVHHVREVMDEVFGAENFVSSISFRKTTATATNHLPRVDDYIVFYAKKKAELKYRHIFLEKVPGETGAIWYNHAFNMRDGTLRKLDSGEEPAPGETYASVTALFASGSDEDKSKGYEFAGKMFRPGVGRQWKTSRKGLLTLESKKRLVVHGNTLKFVRLISDNPTVELSNVWQDTWAAGNIGDKTYTVQTNIKVIQRCLLMTTDPGDLVFDPTCGSGTTAYVAEQWGRRWITCDTSRVALTLAKRRLMTATFDYYKLAREDEGVGGGFEYKTVPHITLKSIANNEPPATETLYDQPIKDAKRARVTGPFTAEAVPSPTVQPIDEISDAKPLTPDASAARSGETLRQQEWRDELLKTGIRGRNGQHISFSRIETLPACRWLHADAETKPDGSGKAKIKEVQAAYKPRRAVISFGPEHAPLEQRQVENALQEAKTLVPKPEIVVFAAFQFDPEAAKDIHETNWPDAAILKAQMNADLLTEDLKKNRSANESFWLVGQPDVQVRKEGDDKYIVSVHGFDYFNTKTGEIESGDENKIAVWMLDTDYDGRSLYPSQVFFPMAAGGGWAKLAKNLKAEIDEELMEAYKGTVSLPFEIGGNKRAAVKIVDDRGIESLKTVGLE